MTTVATFESAVPSFATNVKLSEAVKVAPGEYVQKPVEQSSSVPWSGWSTIEKVSGSFSWSLANSWTKTSLVTVGSSLVSPTATGGLPAADAGDTRIEEK